MGEARVNIVIQFGPGKDRWVMVLDLELHEQVIGQCVT